MSWRITGPPSTVPIDPRAEMLTGDPPVESPPAPAFDWRDDRPPATPWDRTVIYECHVRGMTMRHRGVPESLRGTYLGLASEPVLAHLRDLGVTAVELLPVQHALCEPRLRDLGLTNYWGYNPIGWFAPDERFATAAGRQVDEFREMVRRLHAAGLEVLLDVVFNHTAEGDDDGPALSWKLLDADFYLRDEDGELVDFTGCGNTVDFSRPEARQLVVDCLHHWVHDLHVDGFRFDLATTLGRGGDLLERLAADPGLRGVKLIAEPWDLGPDGYRLGRYPAGWSQWNDRYRDTVRRFWRGDPGQAAQLASRLTGSVDLLPTPSASINYVTCHDGFTLHDLVRFDAKRNDANLEEGRDGNDHNHSRDWGALAPRLQRTLLATLFVSRGVPMIGHGDELGRGQAGNNNAYCHDSELTWVDWEGVDQDLLDFTRRAIAVRRDLAVLRADRPYDAATTRWCDPTGAELSADRWSDPHLRAFSMAIGEDLVILLNADSEEHRFELAGPGFEPLLQSAPSNPAGPSARCVPSHSLVLLGRGTVRP